MRWSPRSEQPRSGDTEERLQPLPHTPLGRLGSELQLECCAGEVVVTYAGSLEIGAIEPGGLNVDGTVAGLGGFDHEVTIGEVKERSGEDGASHQENSKPGIG